MSVPSRVLAADTPEGIATLRKVLGERVELVPATSMRSALGLMPEVRMAICGIHFDSSRMFDLLRMVKADPEVRHKPVVCYRDLDSELSSTVLESMTIACIALGAEEFVDLHSLRQCHGAESADETLRRMVLDCLKRQDDRR